MENYVCPDCRNHLHNDNGKYHCEHCNKDYPVKNGITCFNETDHYYGELSRSEMERLLRQAESDGWESAVSSYLPSVNPGLIPTINNPKRISWISLLNLRGDEKVLDFGCGLGGVSAQIAKHVGEVVALDGSYDRIRFLQIRKDQDDLQNLSLVCSGTPYKLPFQDDTFDVIVLNMVFPYLYVTLPDKNMTIAENIIMQEFSRVLNPEGQLYLSIRNKYSFHRFQITFFPFLFEPGADNFNDNKPDYYKNLLRNAQLTDIRSFLPVPNYKYPSHFIPLDDIHLKINEILDQVETFSTKKKIFMKVINRVGGLNLMAETISFVSKKADINAQ